MRILPKSSLHTPAVHALSLSGSVLPDRLAAGANRLIELGATVQCPDAATATWRYFAGSDDERLAALDASLKGDADIVMFTRGGYGLSRLLHRIDWQAVAASKKLFCGYSDITAFNLAALAEAN
ncbi:MAG: LD-carboxypeptidase, partial [Casimicrobium sp.]